jgi:hypothetical protein
MLVIAGEQRAEHPSVGLLCQGLCSWLGICLLMLLHHAYGGILAGQHLFVVPAGQRTTVCFAAVVHVVLWWFGNRIAAPVHDKA